MSENTLPFDEKRQVALLGYLLLNDRFFTQCKDRIQPNWFFDVYAGKVWATKLNFFKLYHRTPLTWEEFLTADDFRVENQMSRTKMKMMAEEAKTLTKTYGLDSMVGELGSWLHAQAFREGVIKAQELFNAGKCEEAYGIMDQKMSFIKSVNFNDEPQYDWDRIGSEARLLDMKNGLTFGLPTMDKLMSPLGDTWKGEGSMLLGDTTLMIASTNTGKTSAAITIMAANVLNERDCLLLTHEGMSDDIGDKIAMNILNRNRAELYAMRTGTAEERYWFGNMLELVKRRVVYLPINKGANYIEDVDGSIHRKIDLRKAETGKGFDLLIDDYPQKLISHEGQHTFQKRNMDEYVYNFFVQIALNERLHSLVAQQANRSGGKINRGDRGSEDRLLHTEDGNESQGPANISTNVMTINRSPYDEWADFLTYYLGKSRGSKKGWAVACKTRYANAITHSASLGCTYYHGNVSLGNQVESMWTKYRDCEIPRFADVEEAVKKAGGEAVKK